MQFMLAMQTETSNLAEQQKETIKKLQSECDSLQSSNDSLKVQLSESKLRETELASQISWEKLQHDNLVDSLRRQLEEKDAKLVKLKKDLNTNVRLYTGTVQCTLLYTIDSNDIIERSGKDPGPREADLPG